MKYSDIEKLAIEYKEATKKKDKKRVDRDVSPEFFTTNYDYGEPGVGSGLYRGNMDKFKSVKDFLNKSRKQRKRKKKLLDIYSKGPSHQQLERFGGDVIEMFQNKPKHIDSNCEFCPEEDVKLVYRPEEDIWTCPKCLEEYEDEPHVEGEGVFKKDDLDMFTRKRLERDE